MHAMDMTSMQGGSAPPDARNPDYSDGVNPGAMPHMADNAALGMLMIDRLEYFDGREENGTAIDAQAWYGRDFNKLWINLEGERVQGRLQDLRSEALWDHAVSAYWDSQLGIRHDSGIGPGRTWAAFGVQGLAPYWFEVAATAYVGQGGRSAVRFEADYDVLLSQRLILQPRLETNLYGRDDAQREIGSGLSNAEFGLRLRYEFSRQFAPYVGVEWTRKFGRTADFARADGQSPFDAQLVAGVRAWF